MFSFHTYGESSDVNHEEGAELRSDELEDPSIAQLSDACIALERDQRGRI